MKTMCGAILVALALGGCAKTTDTTAGGAGRTVVITMRDNHFEPDEIRVTKGETVRFRFVNQGTHRHDAFLGDEQAQEEHERQARQDKGAHGAHSGGDSEAVTVEPGKSATLVETFTEASDTLIGCHEPGHYKQGMVVKITVT